VQVIARSPHAGGHEESAARVQLNPRRFHGADVALTENLEPGATRGDLRITSLGSIYDALCGRRDLTGADGIIQVDARQDHVALGNRAERDPETRKSVWVEIGNGLIESYEALSIIGRVGPSTRFPVQVVRNFLRLLVAVRLRAPL
jgi:hypothetical protein